jgi:hypothetical protein
MTRARRLGLAMVVLASMAAGVGCDRTPRFKTQGADSLAAIPADSFEVMVQQVREAWESSEPDPGTAGMTARIVLDDLRLHPDRPVAPRVRSFTDSVGLGAEVAGTADLAAANFFARSDPTAGAWPFLFWREESGPRVRALEGSGMRLLDLAVSPGSSEGAAARPDRIAVLFARMGASGQQPLAFVWSRKPKAGDWTLEQSLGPDSLGGSGTARFERSGSTATLVAHTWQPSAGFTECPTCPHVYRTRTFAWGEDGLHSVAEDSESSAYQTFVEFVHALQVGDRDYANGLVEESSLVDAALGYEWQRSKGQWRAAPGTDEGDRDIVFFRGNQEAYRVRFSERGGRWLIASFDPTSRSIE